MERKVQQSQSFAVGIAQSVKGTLYYPLQWAAGLAAAFMLGGANLYKVAAVRASGITANVTSPIQTGIKFQNTPSENLYSGNLLSYAIQRPLFAATMSLWPAAIAIGLTLAMPYIAPGILAAGQALTAAGTAGSLSSAAAGFAGSYLQLMPTAFAMPQGATITSMAMATCSKVFQITLVAAVLTDILNIEKWNPKHTLFQSRAALAR